jgi:hypothetical protein
MLQLALKPGGLMVVSPIRAPPPGDAIAARESG